MATVARRDDLVCRAYVNLTTVRDNLPPGFVRDEGLYRIFNRSLNELQQAGVDVSEWRLPDDAVGNADEGELRARINAILVYFNAHNEKVRIGFAPSDRARLVRRTI